MRIRKIVVVLAVLALTAGLAWAQGPHPQALDVQGLQKLMDHTGNEAKVSLDPATGAARFVRLTPGSLRLDVPLKAAGPEKARAFFRQYGSIFGLSGAEGELVTTGWIHDYFGGGHASFRQTHNGLPVFGRGIALVLRKAVAGMPLVQSGHESVPKRLGQDAGAGDLIKPGIPLDLALLFEG